MADTHALRHLAKLPSLRARAMRDREGARVHRLWTEECAPRHSVHWDLEETRSRVARSLRSELNFPSSAESLSSPTLSCSSSCRWRLKQRVRYFGAGLAPCGFMRCSLPSHLDVDFASPFRLDKGECGSLPSPPLDGSIVRTSLMFSVSVLLQRFAGGAQRVSRSVRNLMNPSTFTVNRSTRGSWQASIRADRRLSWLTSASVSAKKATRAASFSMVR